MPFIPQPNCSKTSSITPLAQHRLVFTSLFMMIQLLLQSFIANIHLVMIAAPFAWTVMSHLADIKQRLWPAFLYQTAPFRSYRMSQRKFRAHYKTTTTSQHNNNKSTCSCNQNNVIISTHMSTIKNFMGSEVITWGYGLSMTSYLWLYGSFIAHGAIGRKGSASPSSIVLPIGQLTPY